MLTSLWTRYMRIGSLNVISTDLLLESLSSAHISVLHSFIRLKQNTMKKWLQPSNNAPTMTKFAGPPHLSFIGYTYLGKPRSLVKSLLLSIPLPSAMALRTLLFMTITNFYHPSTPILHISTSILQVPYLPWEPYETPIDPRTDR